jgi:general stress protein CsbA
VAIFNLVLIDMKSMEIGFRVVAFLIVAVISLVGSLYYTNLRAKKKSEQDQEKLTS